MRALQLGSVLLLILVLPAVAGAEREVGARQVTVDVRFIALDEGFLDNVGVDWSTPIGALPRIGVLPPPSGTGSSSTTPTSSGSPATGGLGTDATRALGGSLLDDVMLEALLRKLEADRRGEILAQPSIVVASGGSQPFEIGDSIDMPVGSAVRPFGVILDVRPVISGDDTVVMDISSGASRLQGSPPQVTQQRSQNQIQVADGQTVAIGGLLRDEDIERGSAIPDLQTLPKLGTLFRSTDPVSLRGDARRTLLVLVTPRILRDDDDTEVADSPPPPPVTKPPSESPFAVNYPVRDTEVGDLYFGFEGGGMWQRGEKTEYGITNTGSPYLEFDNGVGIGEGGLVVGWVPSPAIRLTFNLWGAGGGDDQGLPDENPLGEFFRIDSLNFVPTTATRANRQEVTTRFVDTSFRAQKITRHGPKSDLVYTGGLAYRYGNQRTRFSQELSGGGMFFRNDVDVDVDEHSVGAILGLSYLRACGPRWGWEVGVESTLGVGFQDFDARQTGGAITNDTRVSGDDTAFAYDARAKLGLFHDLSPGMRLKLGFDIGGRRNPAIRDARPGRPLDVRADSQLYGGVSLALYWNPCSTCGREVGFAE